MLKAIGQRSSGRGWHFAPLRLARAVALATACFSGVAGGASAQAGVETTAAATSLPEGSAEPAASLPEARAAVSRGEALFAADNYDGALAEFEHAYALMGRDPRRHALLNNIAVCHERAFRYDRALLYYERYLAEGNPGVADRAQVEAILRTLRGLLGAVEVATNVVAEVWVDGRRIGQAPGRVLVPAGRHIVSLRAPLRETHDLEITVAARQTERVAIDLQALSDYRGLPPGYTYTGVAVTGGLLVTAALFGAVVLSKRSEGLDEARASMGTTSEATEDQAADVRRWMLVTDVTLIAAALAGTTTIVLYLLTDWERPTPTQANGNLVSQGIRLSVAPDRAALTWQQALP